MKIVETARKHGVADDDMRHAVENAIRIAHEEGFTMFIGAGRNGQLIEVGVLHADADDPVVIHAMPLRPSLENRRP